MLMTVFKREIVVEEVGQEIQDLRSRMREREGEDCSGGAQDEHDGDFQDLIGVVDPGSGTRRCVRNNVKYSNVAGIL